VILAGAVLIVGAAPAAVTTQPRSGGTAIAFIAALNQGDVEAALALMTDDADLRPPDGDVLTARAAIAAYLIALPLPLRVQRREFLNGQYEVDVCAGADPLTIRFIGRRVSEAGGRIAGLRITRTAAPEGATGDTGCGPATHARRADAIAV
jgi:hypothetical protein